MALKYNANLEVQYPDETLLGQITDGTRDALKVCWKERSYTSGQIILDAEDAAGDVLILLQGAIRIANFSDKGREVSFSGIDEGDCFGEFAMIDGEPRSASVLAIGETRIAHIDDAAFRDLLSAHPDLSMALMRRLVDRLRTLTRRVSEFTALRADDRIRLEIIRLFEATAGTKDTVLLDNPPTQAALAAFVFTNREAVAREYGRMKREKLIERRGRALYCPSLEKLRDYMEKSKADND